MATTILTPILLETSYTRLKSQDEQPPLVATMTKTDGKGGPKQESQMILVGNNEE